MITKWVTPLVLGSIAIMLSAQNACPQSKQGQAQSFIKAVQTNSLTNNKKTSSSQNETNVLVPSKGASDVESVEKLVSQWNAALNETKQQVNADNTEFNSFTNFYQSYIDSERCALFQLANSGKINETTIAQYISGKKQKLLGLYSRFLEIKKEFPTSTSHPVTSALTTPDTCFPSCTNIDFSTGDFTGWSGYYGVNNSIASYNITNITGGLLGPVVKGALDPFTANTFQMHITSKANVDWFLKTFHSINMSQASPWGGNFSAMIGDSINNGAGVAILSQKFFVSPGTTNFTYQYAVFLENPNHPVFEQPFFKVALLDQNGDTIPFCGQYVVVSKATIPGFKGEYYPARNDTIYWKDWTEVNVPLSKYVGQCVTIVFEVADCEPTGHCGYAYVNASCSPLAITMPAPMLCGQNSGVLVGPAGASQYLWSGPTNSIIGSDTLQNVTIDSAGTYTLVITPVTGAQCKDTLTIKVVKDPGIKVTATSINELCNGGNNASITAIATGGSGAFTYSWSPTGGTNASATGLTAGKYIVFVNDSFGCAITDTITITQPAVLTSIATTSKNVSCNGGNTGSAIVTAAGGTTPYTYKWNPSAQTNATATGLSAGSYTVTVTDAHGCISTSTTTITQPPVLTVTASGINLTCHGDSSGTFSAIATGGTPGYKYLWAPCGCTHATVNGATAGVYSVVVTDTNGCTASATVTLTQPNALVTSIASTNITCNGANNGSATLTVSGGTGAYAYSWNPSAQTNATATGLSAGSYTVTVSDAHGCSATATATITQPTILTATAATTANVSCNGGNNGNAKVTTTGGTSPYTYLWNPSAQTNATATGLSAGNYTITVTDAHGCTVTATTTITQPPILTATTSGTNLSCNGDSTGIIIVVANGGTGPYKYLWAPCGCTEDTVYGAKANAYSVVVTDANGCTASAILTITQPTLLTATATTISNVNCNNANNGSASVTASGGTSAYKYLWSPSVQTNATATGLSAGNYTVTVTDAHGCTSTAITTITQPTVLSISSITAINVSCNNANNGSASVTATGGTSPYNYLWNPSGQTNATATGLSAGSYTITVTDAHGCIATATTIITQPLVLSATATTLNNVTCNGANNGSANVVSTGGTTPYTYLWSPSSQTNATATGLSAGTYTVTVTDAHGCTTSAITTITQPLVLTTAIASSTNVSCNSANNGSASASVNGGTNPYNYLWSPSGQTNATATGLSAGFYTITITDAQGCTAAATITITQPPVLSTTATATNVSCNSGNNGSVTAAPAGGTGPYNYVWNPSGQTNATASGLSAGSFTVTVTDAHGCTTTATANVTQPSILNAVVTTTNIRCNNANNGTANVIATGGTTPYKYLWNPSGQTNATATGLNAGNYTLTVTDGNGCTATASATITQPAQLLAATTVLSNINCNGGNNGSANVTVLGGTTPYAYQWNPSGQSNSMATGLGAGAYTITVTDANGCTDIKSVTITQPAPLTVSVKSSAQAICSGQSVNLSTNTSGGTAPYTYSWSNGSTLSSITVAPIKTTTYIVTITDANGCTTIGTITIAVNPPITAVAQNASVCPGQSAYIVVNAKGGDGQYSFNWTPGGNTTQSLSITPSSTTTYTIIITDGCSSKADTVYSTITVNPLPDVAFGADNTQGCAPLCVQFRNYSKIGAGSIVQWDWNFGDGSISSEQYPIHCYAKPGKYTVILTATSASGCSAGLTKVNYINVYGTPTASFTANPQPTDINNPLINFTDQSSDKDGIATWMWTFGEPGDSNSSYDENPYHRYKDTGTYKANLIVVNVHGCVDSVTHDVVIGPDFTLYFPNAFTPNADGTNETFTAKGSYVKEFEMYIYDRWGMKLYHTTDIEKGWNGTVDGGNTICQEDTYVYVATASDPRGNKHQYLGKVTLIK